MIRLRNSARDLMLWLSTVDRAVLERCLERRPGEATRFIAAGGTVALTTAMAFVSGAYAGYALIHLSPLLSLLFGTGWALGIMNLERYVQSSIRRQRTVPRTLLQALPRLGLAIALGLVISKPLLLRIFRNEVKAQVAVDKNAQRSAAHEALKRQFATVPSLQATERELETELSTPPTTGKALTDSPEYHSLAKRYGRFLQEARNAPSPQTKSAYEHAAKNTLHEMSPLRERLLRREEADSKSRETNQSAQLKATREQLTPLQRELNTRNEEITHRYEAPSGLADQDKALSVLETKNSTVGTEAKLLWLFIIAVDILPALMKTLMSIGRRSVYEETEDDVDQTVISEVKAQEDLQVKESRRVVDEHFQIESEVAEARIQQQIEAQREMDKIAIQTMRETIRPHVERWARANAERYASRLADDSTSDSFTAREDRARSEQEHQRHDEHRRSRRRRKRG